jgi:periplasmic divalent cation tolerance protein
VYIIVFVTAKNVKEANKIATALVKEKLVACANIINGVKSIFTWKGKMDKANEVLLVLKSKKICFPKIVSKVKKLHSYDVPEIIAMPIVGGNKDYLNWIKDSCR